MFVASNSQRQLFDGAKFRFQLSLELCFSLVDIFSLCKCFLQETGGFKPDAERHRTLMIGDRKEWRAGETICRGSETKSTLAAGTGFADGYDCFGGSECSLTVNTSLG